MRRVPPCLTAVLLLLLLACPCALAQRKPPAKKPGAAPKSAGAPKAPASEEAQRAELEEIVRLAPAERVERLRAWVKANPKSPLLVRAQELLTSARAALGDERLRASDRAGGVELFREAVAGAPASMSDELFFKVLAQLPANLFLLGEREAALELARAVEERARGSASRLLSVAPFYLSIERPDEAARIAAAAAELQPDLAAAHQALGAAHRVALRLEDAAAAYARALELDPQSASARRSLADLRRATGKSEEALTLYREQLAADPADGSARAGLVLSLFDAGRREEAERELEAALMEQAGNLPLLVGAAYWYAAQGEGRRALELSQRAVDLEPRYRWVWARLAHARALIASGRPLEAERFIRSARELGSFPTLDYELARALTAAGLYEEAAEELARSFNIRDGQLETRLAGRVEQRAADFEELLAPERRASLFQFRGADTEAQTKQLKALLAFHLATRPGALDEQQAAAAAREFGAGEDPMRAYRNLYVAGRLLQRGGAARAALERTEAAIPGVEAALDVPVAPFALFADEARELRARARELNTPVNAPEAPREQLSKFMRGKIEELAGWALFNEGQSAEAVVRLRRAVGVLPENSSWWRAAEWRLGAALEASGNPRDALAAYVRSYRVAPDPPRLAVIETLYKKLNRGSTEGLDALLAPPDAAAASTRRPPLRPSLTTPSSETAAPPAATDTSPSTTEATPAPTAVTPAPLSATPEPSPAAATPTPEATPEPTPEATPAPEPTPANVEPTPVPTESDAPATPEPTATPEPAPTPEPSPTPTPASEPEPTPTPEPEPAAPPSPEKPASEPTPSPEPSTETPAAAEAAPSRPRERARRATAGGACTLSVSEPSVSIRANGGSATVAVAVENFKGPGAPRINPSTPHWADIIIIAEARGPTDDNSARFTITSISTKTGAFIVTFASPCGKQQLTVNAQ